jgi:hypothetical protein
LANAFSIRMRRFMRGEEVPATSEEIAAFVLSTLEDAGFAVLALTQPTDVRITAGGALCATFGTVDVTVVDRTWWIDHRVTGTTLSDLSSPDAGADYAAALRWAQARLVEQAEFGADNDRCDPTRGYHSTPHRGCILR